MNETKKFELIAAFPNMNRGYNIDAVGDVFTDDGTTAIRDQNGRAIHVIDFEEYPHLFKEVKEKEDKDPNRIICDYVFKFVTDNWDKIDKKKCGINDDKESFLKRMKSDVQEALWVIFEVAAWSMDEVYLKESVIDNDKVGYSVLKIDDTYFSVRGNYPNADEIKIIEPKYKKVIYFD